MQGYDAALKLLLRGSPVVALRELTGTAVVKWLDVELPKVQSLRLDLLGETVEGRLVHLELQSSDDRAMAVRMAEYGLGVYRLFRRFPEQILLYEGEPRLRMRRELRGAGMYFQHRQMDIRELDGERLLENDHIDDNVLAVLARLRDHKDHKEAVHRIVRRARRLPRAERELALAELAVLAGLRSLGKVVEPELHGYANYCGHSET